MTFRLVPARSLGDVDADLRVAADQFAPAVRAWLAHGDMHTRAGVAAVRGRLDRLMAERDEMTA